MTAPASIDALFIAPAAGAPMQRVRAVKAIAEQGLEGDRYAMGAGYYSGRYDCQVTLIEGEVVDAISAAGGIHIQNGEHRRNIVTRGLALRQMVQCRLKIGDVLLEFDRPRPPCDYVQRLTQPGMTRALGRGGGIGMRVLASGWLCEGAEIEVLPNPDAKPPPRLP